MMQRIWAAENRKTVVCVDSYRAGVIAGRIHCASQEAEAFENLTQFLIKMEAMLDDWQMPQAYTALRTFSDAYPAWDCGNAPEGICKGELATFEVQVLYRQHSSWQGILIWREKREEQTFRSVLELVMLMDGALRLRTGDGAA